MNIHMHMSPLTECRLLESSDACVLSSRGLLDIEWGLNKCLLICTDREKFPIVNEIRNLDPIKEQWRATWWAYTGCRIFPLTIYMQE